MGSIINKFKETLSFLPNFNKKEEPLDQLSKRLKKQEHESFGEIDAIFLKSDINKKGYLNEIEVVEAILNYADLHKQQEKFILEQLEEIDFPQHSKISKKEFRSLINLLCSDEIKVSGFIELFKVFDKNLDGTFGIEELSYSFNKLGLKLSKEELNLMLNDGDEDGDSNQDIYEFFNMVLSK